MVNYWPKKADRVPKNNSWNDKQTLRFKGDALDWHIEYLELNPSVYFDDWQNSFIARFRDEADVDKLRKSFTTL